MEVVSGIVEHIVYRNAQNGYTVMELSTPKGPLTLVGSFPELNPGEPIEAEGTFASHPIYGEQFKAESFRITLPQDELAIERYLGSGSVKGVGPALAARIVRRFGADTLTIMENEPDRLAEVKGISMAGARKISEQVIEKRDMREAMMYLAGLGISQNLAVRIYERYGSELYRIIQNNPYQLTDDITHVGFRIADDIAHKAGLPEDSEFRIRSGLYYAMMQALDAGHIYLPRESLKAYASSLLGLPEADLEKYIMDLAIDKRFVLKEQDGVPIVYTAAYYYMEAAVAANLVMLRQPLSVNRLQAADEVRRLEEENHICLEELQRDAVICAIENGMTVITGGPGTGKTTTISTLIRYFEAHDCEILLAAPTGRAAKRITEATGRPAQTIHRLLEFTGSPTDTARDEELMKFLRNEENPLTADVIIIDEVSMVDLPLMYALLKAIIPGTRLILVGDANQLPSVGPGNVLRDILSSGVIPNICLTRIFRQAEASDIVMNAHRIHRGERIDTSRRSRDFLFVKRYDTASVLDVTVRLVRDKLPEYVGADPMEIQVITPMRKGMLGVENLNRVLQEALNPPAAEKREHLFPRGIFRVGDKVMQIKNNYQKEWTVRGYNDSPLRNGTGIFNGDIGIVLDIRLFSEELVVLFDENREVIYSFQESGELELAYAITVHKSQGSEYPAVVLPLLSGPPMLLTRNLIYTAVTRAKACVTIAGSPDTFQQMVDNSTEQKRYSTLDIQLRELAGRTDFL